MHSPLLLNADLGEGFGPWRMGNDEVIMPLIHCANIATGFHASDPVTMQRTVRLAVKHDVMIGAHPGYPDKEGFGRRSMACSLEEITAMVIYQVSALQGMCRAEGGVLGYVKPHGALYNDMMEKLPVFEAVLRGVAAVDPSLPLVVLATNNFELYNNEAALQQVTLWPEAFADRAYTKEGLLMARHVKGSVHQTKAAILAQARMIAEHRQVRCHQGTLLDLPVVTLCVHGDNPESVATVADIRNMLDELEQGHA
ncbi:hypothetical protein CWE15_03975 [Aliidiomarina taiwanensis]|uniref:LamB/YcsF family protein n=1 Tax=Aliidiomarina taiwanensis TaxID=946228 RepID=A0A432XAF5_9GAMM|nr:5-oxoprolinase subunit PxpA [Aliidiomarina taiwanensis]RUO44339.1 hypothetical protein CWE15_03975 [Aliidiomarina taiwanensis]